ncbi:MAG: flagellar export chaperone FliS [Gammaproteobacteria bacterium]|nr:flagellar export chaperone FliS [Gammaproteobacteria bacterium]
MNSYALGALEEYKSASNSSIAYSDPHTLILRLMDGALERIAQAKCAIQQKDVKNKGELISKAISIVGGLNAALDHEQKTEISANLAALYDYMGMRLAEANVHEDISKLDEVSKLMAEIRSAWKQIPELTQSK